MVPTSAPTPGQAPPPPPRRRPGAVRLGSLAGVPVYVSTSWFLVAGLIALLVAPRIEQVSPGLGAGKYVVGLAFAVLLYLAIGLHEASHAVVAKRLGYGVNSITLHFCGGATEMDGSARRPSHEFWIAVVGPLTSIAVGLVSLGLWFVTPPGVLQVGVEGLAGANLLIGVMNLVPGLPLDGGRVLKSVVWGLTRDQHRGTLAAGWGGRVVALAVGAWPLLQAGLSGVRPSVFATSMYFVLGVFMWMGSSAAIAHARLRMRLPLLHARTLARRCVSVPADTPLERAVQIAQAAAAGGVVTLDATGRVAGLVNEAAVVAVPPERRAWVPTASVARTIEPGVQLSADLTGEELVLAISRHPAPEFLLLEPDGTVYGLLATADVDHAFREASR